VEDIYLQSEDDPLLQQEHLGNTYLEMARVLSKAKESDSLDQAINC